MNKVAREVFGYENMAVITTEGHLYMQGEGRVNTVHSVRMT